MRPALNTANWRRRSTSEVMAASAAGEGKLRRSLGRLDLTAMGVATIVGSGIFVVTGVAAATKAGPAIVLSFVLSGLVFVLVALCYGELSSMVPVSGSAYTYSYATLGEIPAFIVGWLLIMEYVVASSAVSIGWSGMFVATLKALFGVTLPAALTSSPAEGGVINLPAVLVILAVVAVLAGEVKLTARVTKVLVAITIGVLLLIIAIGAPHIDPVNWTPFTPFGLSGIVGGAALGCFAFLGFDIVATSAEECRNPRRDLPFGIIATVLIAAVLYAAVSAVLTGVAPYPTLNTSAPVATAFGALNLGWVGDLIFVASVVALAKGLLMIVYGQTRLSYAMCRDGLLPAGLATTSRSGAPLRLTLLLGTASALIAGLTPIIVVAELVNLGALSAFALVAVGVMMLRRLEPDRERPFRVPFMPVVPLLALAGCVALAVTLAGLTWAAFTIWVVVGLVVYFGYGRRNAARVASGGR